jgi:hypothetical protein
MPPYRFLFEKKTISSTNDLKEYEVVITPPSHETRKTIPGLKRVPTDDAIALAWYLTSLKSETRLYEAPVGGPPEAPAPATNAPAAAPKP